MLYLHYLKNQVNNLALLVFVLFKEVKVIFINKLISLDFRSMVPRILGKPKQCPPTIYIVLIFK
jgi:hypothetical protein